MGETTGGAMTVDEITSQNGRGIVGLRWAATWVDWLVIGAAFWVLFEVSPRWRSFFLLWCVLVPLYFVIGEGVDGFTLGKRALGLRVVDKAGNVPGVRRAFIRSLLRIVEVNPILLGGLPAAIIVMCSRHGQRLGDMLAGTYVVTTAELMSAKAATGQDPDLRTCGVCGTPYRLSDYRSDADRILCSGCKAELPRQ